MKKQIGNSIQYLTSNYGKMYPRILKSLHEYFDRRRPGIGMKQVPKPRAASPAAPRAALKKTREPRLTLQAMLNKGPEWLGAYLSPFEAGHISPHSMAGIEAGATSKARTQKSLPWADIAVRAAALHAAEDSGRHRTAVLMKAMALRAEFIAREGAKPGHLVLDPAHITRWFRADAEFDIKTALEKSARWRKTKLMELPKDQLAAARDDLSKLRHLKGRIGVLKTLADARALQGDAELAEWIKIRDQII